VSHITTDNLTIEPRSYLYHNNPFLAICPSGLLVLHA